MATKISLIRSKEILHFCIPDTCIEMCMLQKMLLYAEARELFSELKTNQNSWRAICFRNWVLCTQFNTQLNTQFRILHFCLPGRTIEMWMVRKMHADAQARELFSDLFNIENSVSTTDPRNWVLNWVLELGTFATGYFY